MFEQKTWGDIAELKYGKALSGYREDSEATIPVFGTNGQVGYTRVPQVGRPGVIIGRKGAYRGVHYCSKPFSVIDTAFYLDPAEEVDNQWAYYSLKQADINGLDSGSAIPSLTRDAFYSLPVLVPPPAEQRAIAEVLGALDDKIAANTKHIGTADSLAGALTRRAVDPAATAPLNALATLTMGSSPAGSSYNEIGEGAVFYQGIRDFGSRYPENRIWTTSPVRMAERRDTLLSVRAPVGRLNLANEDTCIGRGLASLRSLNDTPFTLFHVLKDSPGIWTPFEAEGTVFGSINKTQLESLAIPCIPAQLGTQLETELAALEATIENAIAENSSLTSIRDALLPRLMSGKLRVRDAERVIEASV